MPRDLPRRRGALARRVRDRRAARRAYIAGCEHAADRGQPTGADAKVARAVERELSTHEFGPRLPSDSHEDSGRLENAGRLRPLGPVLNRFNPTLAHDPHNHGVRDDPDPGILPRAHEEIRPGAESPRPVEQRDLTTDL